LHEQVDGAWSFVQTQRHLLFAGDAWLGSAVLEEEAEHHRVRCATSPSSSPEPGPAEAAPAPG